MARKEEDLSKYENPNLGKDNILSGDDKQRYYWSRNAGEGGCRTPAVMALLVSGVFTYLVAHSLVNMLS